jgi:hypothetical protein
MKAIKYFLFFVVMAGMGIVLGCWIHGLRTNQPTLMSGVAFVRELPYGEKIVGYIETTVFSYQEKKSLESFKEQHKEIKIDPEVLKRHQQLYKDGSGK